MSLSRFSDQRGSCPLFLQLFPPHTLRTAQVPFTGLVVDGGTPGTLVCGGQLKGEYGLGALAVLADESETGTSEIGKICQIKVLGRREIMVERNMVGGHD
eukprot:sb/3478587/